MEGSFWVLRSMVFKKINNWFLVCLVPVMLAAVFSIAQTPQTHTPNDIFPAGNDLSSLASSEPLGETMDYLPDPEGRLLIDDVARSDANFTDCGEASTVTPEPNQSIWYRIPLRNDSPDFVTRVIRNPMPWIDTVEFFLLDETNNILVHEIAGEALVNRAAPYLIQLPEIYVAMPAWSTRRLFVRIRDEVKVPVTFRSFTPEESVDYQANMNFALGFYYGIILLMFMYNLVLYVKLRHQTYLYYLLYLFFFQLFQLNLNGILQTIIQPEAGTFVTNRLLFFFIPFFCAFLFLFSRSFLLLDQHPLFRKITKLLLPILLVQSILLWLMPLHIISIPIALTAMVLYNFLMITGYREWRGGNKASGYFIISFVPIFIGGQILSTRFLGVNYSSIWSEYAFQIGSGIEAMLLSLALGERMRQYQQEKKEALEKQLIESQKLLEFHESLKRFVPQQFLNYLRKGSVMEIKEGTNISRNLTVVFADLVGFTRTTEEIGPQDSFEFLNQFISRMEPLITRYNGFIDKFIGDSIMAIFEKGENALKASIAMHRSLRSLNVEWVKHHNTTFDIRVTMNSGPVTLGAIGNASRMETTIISDVVNTAAKLQMKAKELDKHLLLTESTFRCLANPEIYEFIILDHNMNLPGKIIPIKVYECLDTDLPTLKKQPQTVVFSADTNINLNIRK